MFYCLNLENFPSQALWYLLLYSRSGVFLGKRHTLSGGNCTRYTHSSLVWIKTITQALHAHLGAPVKQLLLLSRVDKDKPGNSCLNLGKWGLLSLNLAPYSIPYSPVTSNSQYDICLIIYASHISYRSEAYDSNRFAKSKTPTYVPVEVLLTRLLTG